NKRLAFASSITTPNAVISDVASVPRDLTTRTILQASKPWRPKKVITAENQATVALWTSPPIRITNDGEHRNYQQPRYQIRLLKSDAQPHPDNGDKCETGSNDNSSAL